MSYLLDTNVVSEWVKPRPDPSVVRWLADADEDRVFASVITFAEIAQGIEDMPPGRRRDALSSWLRDDLPLRFEGRILDVNLAVASAWGTLIARARKLGSNLHVLDAFFAATAEVHALTLVTRNTWHFEPLNIPLLNPWLPLR